ncbi:hypothetical protein AGMMS49587_18310 [Spirochaetia bacterium]|nr:hypothetical protein AGMMS49587_18310 [Spirochaetia bacterium]
MSLTIPRIFKILSLIIGSVLVLFAIAIGVVIYVNSPPGAAPRGAGDDSLRVEEDGSVTIEVRNGESALSVGKRLEEAGIIRNQYFWHLLSRYKKEYIKTGVYKLELPASQVSIYSVLVSGRQMLHRVTIPEGVTLKKAARIFADAGICDADAFREAASNPELLDRYRISGKTMEGYLFPDTYFFPRNYPPALVIQTMADTFFSRIAALEFAAGTDNPGADSPAAPVESGPVEHPAQLSPAELFRRVRLASIVEREYRVDDEAPLMAGVFYNRLRIGMALQSCATVEYVITEIQNRPHPEVIYTRDTEIRDPYNTYMNAGLPPGPICSPGMVALNAVFNPAESDYLYFRLIDPAAGRHYFSRTLDDHIKAGVFYVKGNR